VGNVDLSLLGGGFGQIFTASSTDALVANYSPTLTQPNLPCGTWSGGGIVITQRYSDATSSFGPVKRSDAKTPTRGVMGVRKDGRVAVFGTIADCTTKAFAVASFDGTTNTLSNRLSQTDPTAAAFGQPYALSLDGGGRLVAFGDLGTLFVDLNDNLSQGPANPSGMRTRVAVALPTGEVMAVLDPGTSANTSFASIFPGSSAWGPVTSCAGLNAPAVDNANRAHRVSASADGGIAAAGLTSPGSFTTMSPLGCTTVSYDQSMIWPRLPSLTLMADGRFLVVGGDTSTGPSNVALATQGPAPSNENGAACTDATQCQSGFCASGFCCDQACTGTCSSCRHSETDLADGTCGPKRDGAKDARCADVYSAQYASGNYNGICQVADGSCDGKGACRTTATSARPCGATVCAADGLSANGPNCDGAGNCRAFSPIPCAPFTCDSAKNACRDACVVATDCAANAYCGSDGLCASKKPLGQPCHGDPECNQGVCVDGYCCNSPCTGNCQACDVTGHEGTCFPVDGDPHGTRKSCGGTGACEGTCIGSKDQGACSFPTASIDCGSDCTSGTFTERRCDGAGTCVAKDPIGCGAYSCSDMAPAHCRQTCVQDADCSTGFVCTTDSKCIPEPKPTCSADGATSTGPKGAVTTCGAYGCDPVTGTCRETCGATSECASGFVCDLSSRLCKEQPPATAPSGGCAIAGGGGARSTSGCVIAMAVSALWIARRRRARRGGR
jgi:hypothetical protein